MMSDREVIARLERLEHENRMLRWVGVAALLITTSLIMLAARRPSTKPSTIEAQQIVLRDRTTGNRVVLDGTGLSIFDTNGRTRVELKEGATGAKGDFSGDWLKFYDGTGRPGIELTEEDPSPDFLQGFARAQSSGNLVMLDYEGDTVSAANLGVGKASGLWLTKTHLKQGREWPENDDVDAALLIDGGSAGMQVQEHGNSRIGLFAKRGMPGLDLVDAAGYETQFGVADLKYPSSGQSLRTSAASIIMLGKGKHVIWRAP